MTPFEVYKLYLALKQHFTRDSYSFFKYNGKVSASVNSFENRRDKFYFDKLSKHRDPQSFILANLINDPSIWIGELVTNDASERRYKDWLKRNQALSYNFRCEMELLEPNFDDNFRMEAGGHPPLLKKYLGGQVSLESLIILLHITKAFGRWNNSLEYDPIWKDIRRKIIKYQPFMKYDASKFRKIVVEKFSENV
jgi:hypothetical protein